MPWLDLKTFTLAITTLLLVGGASGLFLGGRHRELGTRLALLCALAGGGLAAGGAVIFWFWGQSPAVGRPVFPLSSALPIGLLPLSLDLFIDRLAAFFLFLTGTLSSGVALYSFAWLADKRQKHLIAGVYNLFVLAALLLLVINNVYLFLIFLECITLAFSYLTLYKHNTLLEDPKPAPSEKEDAKRAFKIYLIFSHVGVIFITTAFILLAISAGEVSFDALRALDLDATPTRASVIFVLALIGFGIKTAMVPTHSWMGLTHPYLPTSIHALVSSIIIKVAGIYGLIRVSFEFLSSCSWWWGWLVLLLAGATALVGVFYAITSRDLKTALANHSVENIGIILAGIGLALLLSATDLAPSLAGVSLVAGLYHLLNHAVFKSLLFLSTGAIEDRTGTVQLEKLGGLIHRFRWTSFTFLVGAIAIAGFPPFNGFVSEWLTLQSLFASQDLLAGTQPWMMLGLFGALLMLGTAFGLTALAFTKIIGETLLGAPRRPDVVAQEESGDVPWAMRGPLVILAVLCLLLGLLPGLAANQLALIAGELLPSEQPLVLGATATSLALHPATTGAYTARLSIVPLFILNIPLLSLITLALLWTQARQRQWARGPLWTCGTSYRSDVMQITGGAFAFLTWEWAGGRRSEKDSLDQERIPWRLPLSATHYVRDGARWIMGAAVSRLLDASEQFGNRFQGGDIRQYLGYLFVAFIVAVLISVLWQGG